MSVDPLAPDYPMLTPYQFASNTPIFAIDLDGLEANPTPLLLFKGLPRPMQRLLNSRKTRNTSTSNSTSGHFWNHNNPSAVVIHPEILQATAEQREPTQYFRDTELWSSETNIGQAEWRQKLDALVQEEAAVDNPMNSFRRFKRDELYFRNLRQRALDGEALAPQEQRELNSYNESRVRSRFTAKENAVINQGVRFLSSSAMKTLRRAHERGEDATIKWGRLTVQYSPEIPIESGYSAMTISPLSGTDEVGWVLGPRAFMSQKELTKTIFQELHRINFSVVYKTGTMYRETGVSTTKNAFEFAEDAYDSLRQ